jgi:predicted DNA-binding WGR domain protein
MSLSDESSRCISVRLEARDDSRNIRRGYRIERSIDLFGHHIVEWWWGRIGTAGQSRRLSFERSEHAAPHVSALLRRRDTAPRRLGVPYAPVSDDHPPD